MKRRADPHPFPLSRCTGEGEFRAADVLRTPAGD
jgi:hypothetical protein